MARIVQYLSDGGPVYIAPLVPLAGSTSWQPLNPEIFSQPFPVVEQKYAAVPWQGNLPTAKTPHGWEGEQLEFRYALPFPASEQQYQDFSSFQPQGFVRSTFPDGWRGYQLEYQFARPFPATEQQFLAEPSRHVPQPSDVQGWFGEQLEYRFAAPFPVGDQPFTTAPEPEQFLPGRGWNGFQFDYLFAKPFSASEQQYVAFQPAGFIKTKFPDGWRAHQWEYRYALPFPAPSQQYVAHLILSFPTVRYGWWGQQLDYKFVTPFPPSEQIYTTPREPEPPPPPGFGWWGWQLEARFSVPFPISSQQYDSFRDLASIPPYLPPGAGKKRPPLPSWYPQPAYDEEKRKPILPVWDKARGGELEQPEAELLIEPPPIPADLFGEPRAGLDTARLPTFAQFVPGNAHEFAERLRHALDTSDAERALAAFGTEQARQATMPGPPPRAAPTVPPAPKPPVQIAISGAPGSGREQAIRDALDIADVMKALQQPSAPVVRTPSMPVPANPLPKIAVAAPAAGAPSDQHVRDAEDIADVMRVLAAAGYGKK